MTPRREESTARDRKDSVLDDATTIHDRPIARTRPVRVQKTPLEGNPFALVAARTEWFHDRQAVLFMDALAAGTPAPDFSLPDAPDRVISVETLDGVSVS
jgi:hypothetical protein